MFSFYCWCEVTEADQNEEQAEKTKKKPEKKEKNVDDSVRLSLLIKNDSIKLTFKSASQIRRIFCKIAGGFQLDVIQEKMS